ncbi:FAD/NAD(P)-binding protein [Pseudogemmobacter humi]|uniref:FAD-dependent urate hydroxylase HpyO/Asp monooxygenase CreE-like FAD/NAD(P)-binding domain-containing protein n=1 Tax=Pseudogemmobacter humi TaxID=2483812 RepID=A0A3P5XX08_9RHOB|nr:FAD/NAD(P)-binding protein [Pseudogemmobacter humi]VDC33656.1 hypothetical protein XINFAN_03966 [Pseudogemmobacter humi]
MAGDPLHIALTGAGPRALGAAEALAAGARGRPLSLDLYDPQQPGGAGPNFDPAQSPLCLLNTPLRNLDLPGAAFRDWLPADRRDPDSFPPRSEIGAWLAARLAALIAHPPPGVSVQLIPARVTGLERAGRGWRLSSTAGATDYAHVALIPGQPQTAPDDQLAAWQRHAGASGATLAPAYPANALLQSARAWTGRTVAIRGLGLSTLDVLRLLTLGAGGRLKAGRYLPSGREPARILPFSRDGLPPWPKPETAAIDRRFDPLRAETAAFRQALAQAMTDSPGPAMERICAALIVPARRILGTGEGLRAWLEAERDSPGSQETRPAAEVLRHGIAMAEGGAPDPGYTLGQIWRKWQSGLREGFDPSARPETIRALNDFDEGMKRISYGPPVCIARELDALLRAGIVTLCAADDPEVETVPGGWRITEGGTQHTASVMIDAVLPAPKLDTLRDPLLAGLRDAGHLTPCPATGALRTDAAGRVLGRDGAVPGLTLLGRMALGSVIAPDSLHDCFGETTRRHARAVLDPD